MEKRFCESCGNLLGKEDLFCEKCGAKVNLVEEPSSYESKKKDKRYCIGCGALLNEEDKFCQKCGTEAFEENEVIDVDSIDNQDDEKITSKDTKDKKDTKNDKDDNEKKGEENNNHKKKNKERDEYEDKKLCLVCGESLNDEDRFCQKCGTEVIDYYNEKSPYIEEDEDLYDDKDDIKDENTNALFCISCGEPLNDGDRFCQKCGAMVQEGFTDLDDDNHDEEVEKKNEPKKEKDKDKKREDSEDKDNKKNFKNKKECLECGASLNDEDRFCSKCGALVITETNNSLEKNLNDKEKEEDTSLKKNKDDKDKEGKNITEKKKKKNEEEEKKDDSKDKTTNDTKSKKRLCEVCNEELADNDKFCQKCGTKVNEIKDVTLENNSLQDSDNQDNVVVLEKKTIEPPVTNKEPKKKSKIMAFGIILIIILLIVFAVLLYFVLQDKEKGASPNKKHDTDTLEKDDKDKPSDKDDKDDKEDKDHDTTLKDIKLQKFTNGEIIEFYYSSGKYTTTKPRPTSSPTGKVSLENSDFEIFDSFYRYDSNWKVIGAVSIYRDGQKLKIYDSYLNQGLLLGLNCDYEQYKFVLLPGSTSSYSVNSIFGIEARKGVKYEEDQYGMEHLSDIENTVLYDIRKDKKIFESHDYYDYKYINLKSIQAYQGYADDKETILLDLVTEEELMSVETNDLYQCGGMTFEGYGNNYITLGETDCVGGPGMVDLYTTDLKPIVKNVSSSTLSLDGDYLFFRDNNIVHKYDDKGNEINRYKFNKVLDVIGHFFVIVDNNNIIIKDEENLSVVLGSWKDTYTYHSMLSGYYDANVLSNENEKEAGIYLIIQTDEKGPSSGVEYYFNIDTHETKKYDLPQIGGYAKPVLYLYPEKDTNIEVSFENKDNLTTTYPKYKDSWKVFAKTNGDLYDENGKYYYGLYWEEDLNHKVDFSSGFYVEKDNAIEFLEEKLTLLGFSDRERNEFIMYWLPILEKNGKSLVYFELTEERDSYNKLNISPKPDSLLRVAIHVKKVDKKINIKEQNLPTFERVGFTAVEWGGVVYN